MVESGYSVGTSRPSLTPKNREEIRRLGAGYAVGIVFRLAGALGKLRVASILGEMHAVGPVSPS